MESDINKRIEAAAKQQSEKHPVNFDYNPDLFRSEKSPADILYNGKIVGYYDTQGALWRMGDRENCSLDDKIFTTRDELVKALSQKYVNLGIEDAA